MLRLARRGENSEKRPDWGHRLLRHQKGNATKAEAICLSLEIDPLVLDDLSDQGSSHFSDSDKTEFSKRLHRLNSIFATDEVVKFSDGRLTLLSFARWAGKAGIRLPLEMYHWMKESYEVYEEAYRYQKIQEALERCKEIEAGAIVCEVEIPFSCQVMPISQLLQLIQEAPYPVNRDFPLARHF